MELHAAMMREQALTLALDGTVLAVGDAAERFGVPPVAAQPFGENYLHGLEGEALVAVLSVLAAAETSPLRLDLCYPWRSPEGDVRWHLLLAIRRDTAAHEVLLRDVTEELRLRDERDRAIREMGGALERQGDFLSHLCHELRTPLNAIIGFAQVMHTQLFGPINNPRYLSYLENIEESGFALLSTVSELLAMAENRPQAAALRESRFDLLHLLHHVKDAFTVPNAIVSEDVWIEPCMIVGDRIKLQVALHGVIAHALRVMAEGEHLLMTPVIEDNGGVRVTMQCRVSPSFRADAASDALPLPLALASDYLQLHGGELKAQTIAGQFMARLYIPGERVVSGESRSVVSLASAAS